jgi:hypothetical protein
MANFSRFPVISFWGTGSMRKESRQKGLRMTAVGTLARLRGYAC